MSIGGIEWYFLPEAASRNTALWRSWEHLRFDPATGMSIWWRDYADHHLGVLLNPQVPSISGDIKEHRDPDHLEPKKALFGWLRDARTLPP